MRSIRFVVGLSLSITALTAAAHHSQALFVLDPARMQTIRGTVTQFDFRNPHVYLYLETQESNGSTVLWELESSSPPNLARRGWRGDAIRVGEQVTIDIFPAHDPDRHIGRVGTVHFADGRSLSATEGGPDAPPPDLRATSFAGRWWGRSSVRQMQMDRVAEPWPLTPKAEAAVDAYDGSQNPQADCIPMTTPTIMLYVNLFDVTLTDERMDISSEWLDAQRTIWLDGREHPPADERFLQGHSIGHWEDSTLVIDTANYADHGAGNSFEIPSGAQKHTVERMTLSEDGRRIDYSFMLEDPEYMTGPVTGGGHWEYRPELEWQEFECDREVARRFMERLE